MNDTMEKDKRRVNKWKEVQRAEKKSPDDLTIAWAYHLGLVLPDAVDELPNESCLNPCMIHIKNLSIIHLIIKKNCAIFGCHVTPC